jgi:hypothetical protein
VPDSDASGGVRALARRLAGRERAAPPQPIICRRCGARLGDVRAVVRDGRVHLEGGVEATVRVRWTDEDELALEHAHPVECEER